MPPLGRKIPVRSLRDRVKVMRQMHEVGLTDPDVRGTALRAVAGCPARDDRCELEAVFNFVKARVRYTGDVEGHDTYASAKRTLEWGGGDCDDHSVAVATLARHLGFKTGVRVADTGSGDWDHVYAIVGFPKDVPTGYVAMDTTMPQSKPGWEARARKVKDFLW